MRVSVRRTSSVYSLDVVGFIKVVEFSFPVSVFITVISLATRFMWLF